MNARRILVALCVIASVIATQAQTPAPTLKKIASLPVTGRLVGATVCAGGKQVVAVDDQHRAHLWDLATSKEKIFTVQARVSDVGCSRSGEHVAMIASRDGTVYLASATTVEPKRLSVSSHLVDVGSLSPDETQLLAAVDDGPPKLVDVSSGRHMQLQTEFGSTMDAAFSEDGAYFATADGDTKVRIYDRQGHLVSTAECGPLASLAVVMSADGRRAYAGGVDGRIRTINAADGNVVATSEKLNDSIGKMWRSRDVIAAMTVNSATFAPSTIYTFDTRNAKLTRLPLNPTEFLGGGVSTGGWMLVKQEGQTATVWELPR